MTLKPSTMIGETGRAVIANLEALRKEQHLSFHALSVRLGALERPILPSGLHAVSRGRRRVDVDDLAAIAAALGTTPAALLAPPGTAEAEDHPAVRAARELADRVAELATGETANVGDRVDRAMRRLQIEVEEVIAVCAASGRTP